jgi:hypothetical protein
MEHTNSKETWVIDIQSISDEERQMLQEIAKQKGQTLEELLTALGHGLKPPPQAAQVEPEVVFAGTETVETPLITETPPDLNSGFKTEVPPVDVPPPPPAAEEPPVNTEPATGELEKPATLNQLCIQCGWDQDVPTIPEPDHQDKVAFLQTILGQKVFVKRYALFGGSLRVTFRTLTIREIDTLYQETYRAQKVGIVSTSQDYYEYLNRQRLFLQLIGLTAEQSALHIKLPDGLTKETHPEANRYWLDHLQQENYYKEPDPSDPNSPSLMMQVQDYMLDRIIRTEQLQRTITHTCNKFNRLVAKLESCVDNPDFWNETKPQS